MGEHVLKEGECPICDASEFARLQAEVAALKAAREEGWAGFAREQIAALRAQDRALAAEAQVSRLAGALRGIVDGWGEDERQPGWALDDAIASARAVLAEVDRGV